MTAKISIMISVLCFDVSPFLSSNEERVAKRRLINIYLLSRSQKQFHDLAAYPVSSSQLASSARKI